MRSADLVREARLRAGLSQSELAGRLHCSQQQVSRWESGRALPSFETLQAVLRACGLDLSVSLVPVDDSYGALLQQALARTPQQRVARLRDRVAFRQRMRAAQDLDAAV